MRAINHALTGAVIGLQVGNPALAVLLSFISHFVCDAIPHHGSGAGNKSALKSSLFTLSLIVDALLCVALVGLLAVTQPHNWVLAALCAFVATVPDLLWMPGWLRARKGKDFHVEPNWFVRFARDIQWFEKPIGAVVEAVWFSAFVVILITYL